MAETGDGAQERVELRYGPYDSDGQTELPFRILFVGDFTLQADETPVGDRRLTEFDREQLAAIMQGLGLSLEIAADHGGKEAGSRLRLNFSAIEDFSPDAVAAQVPAIRSLQEARRELIALRTKEANPDGLRKALAELASRSGGTIDPAARGKGAAGGTSGIRADIDRMIAGIDRRVAARIRSVIGDDRFLALEAAWRSLAFVAERTAPERNVKLCLLSISREELLADFEDSPEVGKSGLYRQINGTGFGPSGGQPISAVICGYEFGPGSADVKLAQYCASVGSLVHAPFIAGASPAMFGIASFADLPADIDQAFRGTAHAKWNVFRKSDDARHFALVLPHFLLRHPPEHGAAAYDKAGFLWGNAAYALAVDLIERFVQNGWRMDRNPREGAQAADDPARTTRNAFPITDALVSDRKERALAEEGFIVLARRRADEYATFFSAQSVRHRKARSANLMETVTDSLYFTLMGDRLAHYVKVLQLESASSRSDPAEHETELNNWIRQYVSPGEEASRSSGRERPLRKAEIKVSEVTGEPGWFSFDVAVQPHFRYMGATLTLVASGKIDRLRDRQPAAQTSEGQ